MILLGVGTIVVTLFIVASTPTKYTEFTDISDYGNYSGTASDGFTKEFISSLFPAVLDDAFSNIKYMYKAENIDTYGFEAYLELTIEDQSEFYRFISDVAAQNQWNEFLFDDRFMEYSLDNDLDIYIDDADYSGEYHQILQAKIRKVLYSEETQTIIFYAMGVYDGGGVHTGYFSSLFDRFDIDPVVYEQSANAPYGDPYEID